MIRPMRLFKRGKFWHVEFARGKSKSIRTSDEKTARGIFKEMEREYLRGRLVQLDNRRMTIKEFAADYETHRPGVSKWTLKKDMLSLKLLREAVGNVQLKSLSGAKIDEFKRVCLARHAKPQTVNGYLRHIKAALSYAMDNGLIDKRPKIKTVPVDRGLLKDRIVSPANLIKLLEAAKKADVDLWRYFTFLLWTGARRSEALGLKWQDVDFNRAACRLRATKGKQDREVPLSKAVIEILDPIKKDIGPVFPQYHRDTISKLFKRLAVKVGADARLHDLRHSAATYMLRSGIAMEVVQAILGHEHISTTRIYAHVLDDLKQREMQKMRIE